MTKRQKGPRQYNSSLPQRTTRLRASGPIRPTKKTKAERDAKHEREYGGEGKRAFVASLPCIVPGCPNPSEAAHVVRIDGGMGRKGNHLGLAPCCPFHHRDPMHGLHKLGPRTFERLHRVSLEVAARRTEDAWRQHHSAPVPLSRIVPGVVATLRGEA